MAVSYNVTVKDLLSAGLIKAGDALFAVPARFKGTKALINADGQLSVEGKTFATPSAAAKHISGKAENGWIFWRRAEENGAEKLNVAREQFLSSKDTSASASFSVAEEPVPDENVEEDSETAGVISSFGMFWQRNQVDWSKKSNTKILGMHPSEPELKINFADQIGVYLLHDGSRTIYVGRITQKRLGVRLYEHTVDRLSGRWDRFSWFGLSPVTSDGKLGLASESFPAELVVSTMEAVLIEGLEPPQNRRQGDGLKGQEYLQVLAPEIEEAKFKQRLMKLL